MVASSILYYQKQFRFSGYRKMPSNVRISASLLSQRTRRVVEKTSLFEQSIFPHFFLKTENMVGNRRR